MSDDDPEFTWFKRWFAAIAAGSFVAFLVVIGLIAWIVLRVTS